MNDLPNMNEVIEQSEMLSVIRRYAMNRLRVEIPRMSVGSRVTTAAGPVGARAVVSVAPTFESVVLSAETHLVPHEDKSWQQALALAMETAVVEAARKSECNRVEMTTSGAHIRMRNDLVLHAHRAMPTRYRHAITKFVLLVGPEFRYTAATWMGKSITTKALGRNEMILVDPATLVLGVPRHLWFGGIEHNVQFLIDPLQQATLAQFDATVQNPDALVHGVIT